MSELSTILAEITSALRHQRETEILPLAEAARALHVQPITLRRMVKKGKIGFIADAKSYFFKVSDLNAYLEKHYTPAQN